MGPARREPAPLVSRTIGAPTTLHPVALAPAPGAAYLYQTRRPRGPRGEARYAHQPARLL